MAITGIAQTWKTDIPEGKTLIDINKNKIVHTNWNSLRLQSYKEIMFFSIEKQNKSMFELKIR